MSYCNKILSNKLCSIVESVCIFFQVNKKVGQDGLNSSEDGENKDDVEKDSDKDFDKNDSDNKADKAVDSVDKKGKKEIDVKKDGKLENHGDIKNGDEKDKDNDESKTDNDTEGSDKEGDDSDNEDKKGVPLLDQPLEQSGTRERKKVQRFNDDSESKDKEVSTFSNIVVRYFR